MYIRTGVVWSAPVASNPIAVFAWLESAQPASPDTMFVTVMPALESVPASPGKSAGVAGGAVREIVAQAVATTATNSATAIERPSLGDPRRRTGTTRPARKRGSSILGGTARAYIGIVFSS